MINKGILFEVNNSKIVTHLYIDGGKLLDKFKNIIFDFNNYNIGYTDRNFFGWGIEIITEKLKKSNGRIYFSLYYIENDGNFGSSDEFSYDWDSQKERFILHKKDLGLVPM